MTDQSTIRVVEKFGPTVQGEGKHVGAPSIFVRVFGCNATCAGFGQPRGAMIPSSEMPHNSADLANVKSVQDLPVFDIGCDSSAAWSKRYRHLTEVFTPKDLLKSLQEMRSGTNNHLVITGGEPLLKKYQQFWGEMFLLDSFDFGNVTFETNGTQPLSRAFRAAIQLRQKKTKLFRLTFSVSPKLSISGESRSKMIVPEAVQSYVSLFECPLGAQRGEVYLKFVIRDVLCIPEVKSAIRDYGFVYDVYLMPEGATVEGLKITEREVAEISVANDFKFSPRLHCHLYGNSWGT